MQYNPYDYVMEFVRTFKRPVGFTKENINLADALINEEFDEVDYEFNSNNGINRIKLTEELADLQYVVNYAAVTLGLPLKEVFEEKHRANMTKLDDNGEPVLREDGKILKGPNYEKPDYTQFF